MDSPEAWRDIPGYEGYYQVSDHGRVKALARVVHKHITKPGQGSSPVQFWRERILKPTKAGPYPHVTLRRDATKRTYNLHELVLITWVGPPPPVQEGCHYDGNPLNNCLDNLRWDTRQNNHADKKRHGTQPLGEKNHNAKLTDAQVHAIRADMRNHTIVAREYGTTKENVSMIRRGISWKHLPLTHADHTVKGQQNGQHKLTDEQVRAIRTDHRTQHAIAQDYGISRTTVSKIKNGKLWKHLI